MRLGNRGPGSPSRRRHLAFRPISEDLEARRLLSTVDVTGTQTDPLGVEMIGSATNNEAGYTVTDVGNVTGSGYDSFIVASPGLTIPVGVSPIGTPPTFGGLESAAYLVIGSKQVNASNAVDFAGLTPAVANTSGQLISGQRAGDLGQLGTIGTTAAGGQVNPTVVQPTNGTTTLGFNYDGLTFVTGLDGATGLGRNSALGYSVTALGDINNDGFDDFAIGAPNDLGGGKVFVIYGGTALANQPATSKTIDLEPTQGTTNPTTPTKVVSFSIPNTTQNLQVGYSVAGLGNFFNTSTVATRDIGIGVPGALNNAGEAFAVSGAFVNSQAAGTNIDLSTIDLTGNPGAIAYTGFNINGRVGSSIASAGSFDGATGSNSTTPRDSLLIGANGVAGGAVYLVYGAQDTTANSTLGSTLSLSTLGVAPTTSPVTTPLQGDVFIDQTIGDRFGFSLASAGDFNNDGAGDIIIGAPGYSTSTGYAEIIYGQTGTSTSTVPRINGIFSITPTATTTLFRSASLVGEAINNFVGYSVAPTIDLNATASNASTVPSTDVLIGAPGARTNGAAYLIPGTIPSQTALTGPQLLATVSTATSSPSSPQVFSALQLHDPAVQTIGLGTSVSALNPVLVTPGAHTLDSDQVPDLFIGAPYSNLLNPSNVGQIARAVSGVAYAIEGSLIGGTGGGTGGGGGGGGGGGTGGGGTTSATSLAFTAFSFLQPTTFTGEFGGAAIPPVSSLEHLTSYQPLPVQLAYDQFLDAPGFRARQEVANNPGKGKAHQAPRGDAMTVGVLGRRGENKYLRVYTIPKAVFTHGNLKAGKTVTFTHKVKVIPRSEQTETFVGQPKYLS